MTNLQTAVEALNWIELAKEGVSLGVSDAALKVTILQSLSQVSEFVKELAALRQVGTVDMPDFGSESLAIWAVEQGYQTWVTDHAAVLRNLILWLRSNDPQPTQPAPKMVSREAIKSDLLVWLRSVDWSPSLIEVDEFCESLQPPAQQTTVPSRWIPVEERLPKHDQAVLVYRNGYGQFLAVWNDIDHCWDDEAGDDYWHDRNYFTHWQPLPPQPKGEQDD